MHKSVWGPLRGVSGFVFLIVNTLLWAVPIYILGLVKLMLPFRTARTALDTVLDRLSYTWMLCNNGFLDILKDIDYEVTGLEKLRMDQWCLVISNHQTWVDIIALQKILHNRIPFLKYFLKKELIWVPILGLAWWALDYPFMKRYSGEYLSKHPDRKGKDIEMTRKACEKFKAKPVSMMNFVEGTRFSAGKHKAQKSPFRHLLRPRSGGIAFVLSSMGEYMSRVIDITIVYPDGVENIWEFMCSKKTRIRVHIEILPIEGALLGDYFNDDAFRNGFQEWLNALWSRKDARISAMLADSSSFEN
ncbi:MAG TPA: acyltransferase [Spirochaetota bacterium]|nr:acyltransferase [Spirochaetota bacterium]HRZ27047.1 acyltransferase [Spirochaetota bacterium]